MEGVLKVSFSVVMVHLYQEKMKSESSSPILVPFLLKVTPFRLSLGTNFRYPLCYGWCYHGLSMDVLWRMKVCLRPLWLSIAYYEMGYFSVDSRLVDRLSLRYQYTPKSAILPNFSY